LPVVLARYVASFFLACMVVFGLFWLMQYLIATANRGLDKEKAGYVVDFVRVKHDENIDTKKPKPKKPPPPDEAPPEPPPPSMDSVTPDADAMAVSAVPVQTNINLSASGFGLAPSDGEYLPIVKVQPIYPRRALQRGIEGYVIVEFTVTKQGTTKDIHVVEADPQGMFDQAAMQAAAKFKYKPRVVDGQPIEVPGVRNKITFEIEE
jgi:periplasmic protein TonB